MKPSISPDAAIEALKTELRHYNIKKLEAFIEKADRQFGLELDRVQSQDPKFRQALIDMLAADEELERRYK